MPQKMTIPKSAPNSSDTARIPGVGGTIEWVRELPSIVKAPIVDIDLLFRLEITEAIGAIRTCVMSPNTGIDIIKLAKPVDSSRDFPLKSLIKKLTIDFAEPDIPDTLGNDGGRK